MNLNSKTVWTGVVFIFLTTGMLGLSLTSAGLAASPDDEKTAVSHRTAMTMVTRYRTVRVAAATPYQTPIFRVSAAIHATDQPNSLGPS